MSTINERISYLVNDLGETRTSFAEKINLSQPFISAVCSGTKLPSDRTISDICRVWNVSEAWLRDGAGEMYVKRSANEELSVLVADLLTDADDSFRKRFISLLLALPPESWAAVEQFIKSLTNENTADA